MSCKWSLFGAHRFYTAEEALTILTNMNDFEDESTSESENEGDLSDSSEYAPEQHQVRTDSNIQAVMPKETKVSKAKEIPKKGQKAAPKLVDNQSATKHALLADQTATTSGEEHVASPPKVSKVSKAKEKPKKGQKAAPKLVDNQSATKHALLADQTATTSGEEHVASPPKVSKVSKAKKNPKRGKKLHQNWLIIRVPQSMLYWLIKQPPHQVRNMLLHLQKYLKYLKPKNPKKSQKAAPKLVDNQSATKHALLADQTATTSGEEHVASPPKVSKVSKAKEKPKKGQKAAPKLVDNQHATKHALLTDQTATTSGEEHDMLLYLQKYLKPKKNPKRAKKLHQNWLIIRVPQRPWHPIVIWM